MKTNCQKCGCKFSKQEINSILETMQYCEPIFICDECYEDSQSMICYEHEQYSDADIGL